MSTHIVWDAFKAVLRGKLISLNATTRRKCEEQYSQLVEETKKKELELTRKPGSKKLEKQLRFLKQQINNFNNTEVI